MKDFKPCANCVNPSACRRAGKCLLKQIEGSK